MDKTKLHIIKRALQDYGTRSIPGAQANNKILSYFDKSGQVQIKDDEIPWCSAFMNAVMGDLGLPTTQNLGARNWLSIGELTGNAEMGDIVILWRESPTSWKGHVGLYICEEGEFVWILGGNQNNEVNISKFPKSRILAIKSVIIKTE